MMHMRLRAMADDAEPVIGPRSALIRWLIRPQAIATHRHIPRIRAPLESLRVKTWRIKTGELRPGESDEWLEVVFVGSLKRFDINRSSGSRGLQTGSAPGETLAAQLHDQHIGCETRPASIAIRERMHGDQAVMESDGDVVGRIGFVFDPIADVVDRLAERGVYFKRLDAKIALCRAILSCPAPNTIKHAAV